MRKPALQMFAVPAYLLMILPMLPTTSTFADSGIDFQTNGSIASKLQPVISRAKRERSSSESSEWAQRRRNWFFPRWQSSPNHGSHWSPNHGSQLVKSLFSLLFRFGHGGRSAKSHATGSHGATAANGGRDSPSTDPKPAPDPEEDNEVLAALNAYGKKRSSSPSLVNRMSDTNNAGKSILGPILSRSKRDHDSSESSEENHTGYRHRYRHRYHYYYQPPRQQPSRMLLSLITQLLRGGSRARPGRAGSAAASASGSGLGISEFNSLGGRDPVIAPDPLPSGPQSPMGSDVMVG
ncbi:hypothetical protein BV898_15573 [Hypsibius exemplaris]|uniref:Uncharacterized protein n=1 Tax=Hypsibius exemplaris TaxID=2072580 RepID=A0A9X6NI14_HYPEX|nr:hypothetical protein BV898_15573 [Hypsibius exemplaris]